MFRSFHLDKHVRTPVAKKKITECLVLLSLSLSLSLSLHDIIQLNVTLSVYICIETDIVIGH